MARRARLWLVVLMALAFTAWAAGTTVAAAGAWFVGPAGNDANDCQGFATACRTVGAAVGKASSGDIVVIAGGTYTENLWLDKSLSLIGFGADQTLIDGSGQMTWTVVISTGAVVSLADVRISHGSGGIWNQGVLTLSHSTVSLNQNIHDYFLSPQHGGGVLNEGRLAVLQSLISSNVADREGGGLYNRGTALLRDTDISQNRGLDLAGGIYNDTGSVTLEHSTLLGNRACGFDPNPQPVCPNALGTAHSHLPNVSSEGLAGGIVNYAILTATDTLISGNVALNWAGGIDNNGTLVLSNVTMSQNRAVRQDGGAIRNRSGTLQATNVTFSDNNAYYSNAIYMSGGVITLTDVTVSSNLTSTNLFHDTNPNTGTYSGSLSLLNTIITNSVGSANCAGPIISLGHNLSGDDSCGLTATGDLTNTNPLLGPLQDNGGPTPTHALLAGSPAINHGDNSGCPAADQRGVARPQAGTCDIGAYEYVFPFATFLPAVRR